MNNQFINHHRPERNGRNHAGYGNTPPIDDRTVTRSDVLWGLAAAIGLCGMGYFLSYIGAL